MWQGSVKLVLLVRIRRLGAMEAGDLDHATVLVQNGFSQDDAECLFRRGVVQCLTGTRKWQETSS